MSPIAHADWKRYEKQIEARLRAKARGPVTITANATLPGRISGVDRQIDILVDGQFSGITSMKMIVDCKCWSTKVDVKDMESFIGMVQDVGVQAGMLITTMGVTPAAALRGAHILMRLGTRGREFSFRVPRVLRAGAGEGAGISREAKLSPQLRPW